MYILNIGASAGNLFLTGFSAQLLELEYWWALGIGCQFFVSRVPARAIARAQPNFAGRGFLFARSKARDEHGGYGSGFEARGKQEPGA